MTCFAGRRHYKYNGGRGSLHLVCLLIPFTEHASYHPRYKLLVAKSAVMADLKGERRTLFGCVCFLVVFLSFFRYREMI